jgi:hypothetical protein
VRLLLWLLLLRLIRWVSLLLLLLLLPLLLLLLPRLPPLLIVPLLDLRRIKDCRATTTHEDCGHDPAPREEPHEDVSAHARWLVGAQRRRGLAQPLPIAGSSDYHRSASQLIDPST